MKITRSIFLFTLLIVATFIVRSQDQDYSKLPYFCGFESPEDTAGTYGWKFAIMPKTGHSFVIGEAVHRMGSHAMYVSTDGVAVPNSVFAP